RLDPRAGIEARRVELVPDCDPVPLCVAAAGAYGTLPADRLHWAVVEHRRVHDLDSVGAIAVRDTHHGRSRTGYSEFRGSRRADHDRRARFRSAADVGCGEGTALSDSDPSGPVPESPPTPESRQWAGLPWVWAVPVVAAII